MTTYTALAKNQTTYATTQKSDATTNDGKPMGLLLVLTYSNSGVTYTSYDALTKNQTIYSTINKN